MSITVTRKKGEAGRIYGASGAGFPRRAREDRICHRA